MFAVMTAAANSSVSTEIDVLGELTTSDGAYLGSVTVIPSASSKPTEGDHISLHLVDENDSVLRDLGSYAVDPNRQLNIPMEDGAEGTYINMPTGCKLQVTYTNTGVILPGKLLVNANPVTY